MQKHTKHRLELNKKYFSVIPAFIWAGIIVFMSLLPNDKLPEEVFVASDKFIHASIYFILTLLFFLAFVFISNSETYNDIRRKYLVSLFISLVLGILVEIAQDKMNIGRTGDWKDVIANLIGTVIVYPLALLMQSSGVLKKLNTIKKR